MTPGTLIVVVLVGLRLVPMTLVPVWGGPLAPWPARVALAALGAIALALVQPPAVTVAATALPTGALIAIALKELAVGAVLALIVAVPFVAADLAGRWIGGAIGLDGDEAAGPSGPTSAGGAFIGLLAVVIFFGLDGHLVVAGALAGSYQALPLLGGFERGAAAREVLGAVALLFAAGVALAAPALVAAALVEVGLGVVGRGGAAGVTAGLGALRGAAIVGFLAASLWVLAVALADGGLAALRTLEGAIGTMAPG